MGIKDPCICYSQCCDEIGLKAVDLNAIIHLHCLRRYFWIIDISLYGHLSSTGLSMWVFLVAWQLIMIACEVLIWVPLWWREPCVVGHTHTRTHTHTHTHTHIHTHAHTHTHTHTHTPHTHTTHTHTHTRTLGWEMRAAHSPLLSSCSGEYSKSFHYHEIHDGVQACTCALTSVFENHGFIASHSSWFFNNV